MGATQRPGDHERAFSHLNIRHEISEAQKKAGIDAGQRESDLSKIMQDWDEDSSGGLKWTELQSLLKDLAAHHGHPEYTPADEDIKWVIKHATKGTNKDGHRWSEWRNGMHEIDKGDLRRGVPQYLCYLAHLDLINAVFEDFDIQHDNHLEKFEVKAMLTQLNNGHPPSEQQLNEVMTEADEIADGTVTKLELGRAIAVWYTMSLPSDQKDRMMHGTAIQSSSTWTGTANGAKVDEGLTKLAHGSSSSACCMVQ